jgi:hypothetical protein
VRSEILDDPSAINEVVEERLASYSCAHTLATGKRRGVRATWALPERPMILLTTATEPPPDDQHTSTDYIDPINSPMPCMMFKFRLQCITKSMPTGSSDALRSCSGR